MPARQPAGRRRYLNLTSYISGVQAAGDGCVRCAFDDGPAVGEERHLVGLGPELQDEIVVPHRAVRLEAGAYFRRNPTGRWRSWICTEFRPQSVMWGGLRRPDG